MHAVRLINHLDRTQWIVEVACVRGEGAYVNALPPDVRIHVLCPRWLRSSTLACLWAIGPLTWLLREMQPAVVCSLLPHTNVLLGRARRRAGIDFRTVLGVQNNPGSDWNRRGWAARLTAGQAETVAAYRNADVIVALSHGVEKDLGERFPDLAGKTVTIYNIGYDERVLQGARETLPAGERPAGPLLVACGRLEEQKDYPTLIRAVARLQGSFPGLGLIILGQGRARPALEKMVTESGLKETVRFAGFQSNPHRYMAAADIFVLSSRWEGFGNVLVEAMACGAPVVSTDCPFGPREILDEGKFGALVPVGDHEALAKTIADLLRAPVRRAEWSAAGRTRAAAFLPGPIAQAYERVFTSVVTQGTVTRLP